MSICVPARLNAWPPFVGFPRLLGSPILDAIFGSRTSYTRRASLARLFDEGRRALSDVFFFRLPQHFFLDFHVTEFVRVEYLATIQTFDVFNVLFTRYDAHFGVFAGGVHLGGLSVQPVLLGKIVPAGFRLSNLFLC